MIFTGRMLLRARDSPPYTYIYWPASGLPLSIRKSPHRNCLAALLL
jgi:hypothetical protein